MNKRVRVGCCYYYDPVPIDRIDSKFELATGTKVKVINLRGCPKANTMGHCYIGDAETGEFIGMVCTNSLYSEKEWQGRLKWTKQSEYDKRKRYYEPFKYER